MSSNVPEGASKGTNVESNSDNQTKESAATVVVITNAGAGLGRSTALAFSDLPNHQLVLVDSKSEELIETSNQCSIRSRSKLGSEAQREPMKLTVDLAAGESIARSLVDTVLSKLGRLDTLVNCPAWHLSGETRYDRVDCVANYHQIVAANQHALVHLSLAAFEPLSRSRGSIVNVSAPAAPSETAWAGPVSAGCAGTPIGGQRYKFGHCMTRTAVAMLTKCLASDFAPKVRVNCVAPGPIASSIFDDMGLRSPEHQADSPAGRRASLVTAGTSAAATSVSGAMLGAPEATPALEERARQFQQSPQAEEVAKMIIYLSSRDKAQSITGSRVLIDAGYHLG